MKKSFLNIALIVLFILAMSSVNLSAPKYKVKTVLTGDQTGVAQEGVPGGVVSYVIEILCTGGDAEGSTYIKSIDIPTGATWSLGPGSYPVSENIITLNAATGTVILYVTTGTAIEGNYYVTLGFQPNSNTTFGYIVDAPVPVEMKTFSGTVDGNAVSLKWATATEVNNYGFDIERSLSASGTNWEKIGFVNGNGNSNSPKEYSYMDKNLKSGSYSYRLKQIDNDGTYDYSNIVELKIGLPINLELKQNYPNPFNPSTTISFTLSNPGNVSLKIYNSLGEEIAELVNGFTEAGVYSFNFNAETLASGTYIYQLKTNETSLTKKMLFLK